MYNNGYNGHRRFGWLPILLAFIFVLALLSGGFHRPWFFFWPMCFVVPFFFVGGVAVLFMLSGLHRWHGGGYGDYPKHKHGGDFFDGFDGEKRKRHDADSSDIFYV